MTHLTRAVGVSVHQPCIELHHPVGEVCGGAVEVARKDEHLLGLLGKADQLGGLKCLGESVVDILIIPWVVLGVELLCEVMVVCRWMMKDEKRGRMKGGGGSSRKMDDVERG